MCIIFAKDQATEKDAITFTNGVNEIANEKSDNEIDKFYFNYNVKVREDNATMSFADDSRMTTTCFNGFSKKRRRNEKLDQDMSESIKEAANII